MTISELRREARDRNLPWDAVREAYQEIREAEWEKRRRPNAVRETAWMLHKASSPGYWPFWRFGFADDFGNKIARGADYTIIPGYDEIAQEIGWEFSEYATEDGTERLWEFLLSPYDRMPPAEEMWRRALNRVEFELLPAGPAAGTIQSFVDEEF